MLDVKVDKLLLLEITFISFQWETMCWLNFFDYTFFIKFTECWKQINQILAFLSNKNQPLKDFQVETGNLNRNLVLKSMN